MAQRGHDVMPAASPRSGWRRPLVTGVVLVLAAVLGAAAVVALGRGGEGDAEPRPQASSSSGVNSAGVLACVGGPDPTQAVLAAVRGPATPEGAAEAAAAVVRFTESRAFGELTAGQVIAQIGDSSGSPELVTLQQGQAPAVAQMTATDARPGQGVFAVTPEPLSPTVTVVTPVEWSTGNAQHRTWRAISVQLMRMDNRWAVVSAGTAALAPDLASLRGAEVQDGDLDRYSAALTVNGFRRYEGDC